jgi:hypothetical protein
MRFNEERFILSSWFFVTIMAITVEIKKAI